MAKTSTQFLHSRFSRVFIKVKQELSMAYSPSRREEPRCLSFVRRAHSGAAVFDIRWLPILPSSLGAPYARVADISRVIAP
jgi:hypothetical protein